MSHAYEYIPSTAVVFVGFHLVSYSSSENGTSYFAPGIKCGKTRFGPYCIVHWYIVSYVLLCTRDVLIEVVVCRNPVGKRLRTCAVGKRRGYACLTAKETNTALRALLSCTLLYIQSGRCALCFVANKTILFADVFSYRS